MRILDELFAVEGTVATRGEKPHDPTSGLRRLRTWLSRWPLVWSHLCLTGLAVRPSSGWRILALRILLVDAREAPAFKEGTASLCLFRSYLPIRALPKLVGSLCRGRLTANQTPLGEVVRVCNGGGQPFRLDDGNEVAPEHDWPWQNIQNRWRRWECRWEADASLRTYFDDNLADANVWFEQAESEFLLLGYGTVAAAAEAHGIVEKSAQLYRDRKPFVELVAPFPLAFERIRQTNDRTAIQFRVASGALLDGNAVVILENGDRENNRWIVKLPSGGGSVDGTISVPDEMQQATLLLAKDGRTLHRETCDLKPALRVNTRLALLRHLEGQKNTLDHGLGPPAWGKRPNADAFERSIYHLLSLLGFSVLWWGDNAKRDSQNFPHPHGASDMIAFSSDESLVLMVECTVEPRKPEKLVELVTRRNRATELLRHKCGLAAPSVHAVYAVPVPRSILSNNLTGPAERDDVTIISRDEIDTALALLNQGVSQTEMRSALPEPLAFGFQVEGRFELWPRRGIY